MSNRKYKWFLEPKDNHSNSVIAKTPGVEEENFHENIVCADNHRRNLWECSYEVVIALLRSAKNLGLKFSIWSKEGGGKIYDKTNWLKSRI